MVTLRRTACISRSLKCEMSSPTTSTRPVSGFRKPIRIFSATDFPTPERPRMHSVSPGRTEKLTSSSTTSSSKEMETWSKAMYGPGWLRRSGTASPAATFCCAATAMNSCTVSCASAASSAFSPSCSLGAASAGAPSRGGLPPPAAPRSSNFDSGSSISLSMMHHSAKRSWTIVLATILTKCAVTTPLPLHASLL